MIEREKEKKVTNDVSFLLWKINIWSKIAVFVDYEYVQKF